MKLQIFVLLIFVFVWRSYGRCPADVSTDLQRLGKTRFYIVQRTDKRTKAHHGTWNQAYSRCEGKGLHLASVNKLTTFHMIAQNLRPLVEKYRLRDTWYWLAAKYDKKKQQYRWHYDQDTAGPYINYTNFLYREPRPTGVGAFVSWNGIYDIKNNAEHCLTFAFPYPGYDNEKAVGTYGTSAVFDERSCTSNDKHTMCEADYSCRQPDPGPYVLSEGKEEYFDEGNWIIGTRKYIVNWAQRNKAQASEYCKSLGLDLYSPDQKDVCMIPHMKMWSRNVTSSQFWSGWSYDRVKKQYLDAQGQVRFKQAHVKTDLDDNKDEINAKSDKLDKTFCVSMAMYYEFTEQMPCPKNRGHCHWHFMDFVPSNCLNLQGTICQHKDHPKRECVWKKTYLTNVTQGLVETATVPFGFEGNDEYVRSTFKQTFGSLWCPPGFNMVRERAIKWHYPPSDVKPYKYDYMETYWVVDPQKFDKNSKSVCSVSRVRNGKRGIEKVKCTEWHFYLCKKRYAQPSQPPKKYPEFRRPDWKWNDRPTPRPYGY